MSLKTKSILDFLQQFVDSRNDKNIKSYLELTECITDEVRNQIVSLLESFKLLAKELEWRDPSLIEYDLASMLFMFHLAGMMGYTNVTTISEFWVNNSAWLVYLYPTLGAVPSRTQLDRVKRMVDSTKFSDYYQSLNILSFIRFRLQDGSLTETDIIKRLHLSADGQTLNGTHLRKKEQEDEGKISKTSGMDIISIYCYQYGMSINMRLRNLKNHEAEAIKEMIEQTPDAYRNTIISFDALNTHDFVLNTIIDANADYFCAVKANQKNFFGCIKRAFSGKQWEANRSKVITGSFDTEDGTNTNWTVRTDVKILPFEVLDSERDKKKFPHTKAVLRFETMKKNLTSRNECYREVRYFITSLPADLEENPNVAEDFVKLKLRRWGVEVSHFHIDGNLRQDEIVFRSEKSAFFSGAINKIVMKSLLPYVEEQKFFSKQGAAFSVGDSLVHTGRCTGVAASLLADGIGMDMQLMYRIKDFELNTDTDCMTPDNVLTRYIYHTEKEQKIDTNGNAATEVVPHGQQLKNGWSDSVMCRNLGLLKIVSKDAQEYEDQGIIFGNFRLILVSTNLDDEDAAPCNYDDYLAFFNDEKRSLYSADHRCRYKFRDIQSHDDDDGFMAKCKRKRTINTPSAERQAA